MYVCMYVFISLRRKEKFKKRREEKKLERKQKIAEKRPNQSPSVFRRELSVDLNFLYEEYHC